MCLIFNECLGLPSPQLFILVRYLKKRLNVQPLQLSVPIIIHQVCAYKRHHCSDVYNLELLTLFEWSASNFERKLNIRTKRDVKRGIDDEAIKSSQFLRPSAVW